MKRKAAHYVKVGFALASISVLGACSSLPANTEPTALHSFEPPVVEEESLAPQDGREPDLLLRDFYAALARPTQDYQAARAFLAGDAAQNWRAEDRTLVVDRIDINSQVSQSENRRVFDVSGIVVGQLATDGSYTPDHSTYTAHIEMQKVDGQWRITALPAGVVIERVELRNHYDPRNVYFLAPGGNVLAQDRRWTYNGQTNMVTVLVNMLIEGPSQQIRPGVFSAIPKEATFLGLNDGVYEFTGFQKATPEERLQFGAQLVWTLADAGVPGPYDVLLDGVPLSPGYASLSTDDFAAYNPQVATAAVQPIYALHDGHVYRVASSGIEPVPGEVGVGRPVQSADISPRQRVAAVRATGNGNEKELVIGTLDGAVTVVGRNDMITRPSFEFDDSAVWTVVGESDVVRVVRAPNTGDISQQPVDTSSLSAIEGEISVLRLSPSGVRVAMTINGHLYMGVVERQANGARRIVNVHELAPALAGTAVSVAWQPAGSLVVGTSSAETPIWRVEYDGSAVATLPSGNVTAPVVAVASTGTTVYLTDAIAIRQYTTGAGADTSFWREVPGLQGLRSAPIVAQ